MYEEIQYLRQRIDELERRMTVIGDDITTAVDYTPSGQIVRSLYEMPEEVEASAEAVTEYISVSYDAVAEEFTVTVTDLPVLPLRSYNKNNFEVNYPGLPGETSGGEAVETSQTFVFDKPTSTGVLTLQVDYSDFDNKLAIKWFNKAGKISSSDTDTNARISSTEFITSFAEFSFNASGTYGTVYNYTSTVPVIVGEMPAIPRIEISTSARTMSLNNVADPLSGVDSYGNVSYAEPFDDLVILGYDYGSPNASFDLYSERFTYDTYKTIGRVTINASNVVTRNTFFNRMAGYSDLPMGYTGTASTGDTLTIKNGFIVNVT